MIKHLLFSSAIIISFLSAVAQNVGVGESSPTTRLEVRGHTSGDLLNIKTNTGISRLYVMDGGNVGIGTDNPAYTLDVYGTISSNSTVPFHISTTGFAYITSASQHVAFYKKSGAYSFYFRKSDNGLVSGPNETTLMEITDAGNINFSAANPTITASSYLVIPGGIYCNSGTSYFQTPTQFRGGIQNDGGDLNVNDNLIVNGYARIIKGVHTSNSDNYTMELNAPYTAGDGEISIRFHQDNRFFRQIRASNATLGFRFTDGHNSTLQPLCASAYNCASDSRIKTNLEILPYGLKEILALKPLKYFQHDFNFDNKKFELLDKGASDIGLIAQETYQIIPEAATAPSDENKDIWVMNYPKLIPVIIKAMQEQQALIEKLQKENKELVNKTNDVELLKAKLEKLESYIYSEAKK